MALGKTIMAFGPGGQGKSSVFARTAPGPRLLLDSEFRADSLPGKLVEFNLNGSTVPAMDEDTTLVAFVRDASDVAMAVKWLKSGKLKVRSVGLDSVSALQQSTIDAPPFSGDMDRRKWGVLLKLLAPDITALMKMAKDPAHPLELAYITAWNAEKTLEGEVVGQKPYVQGALLRRFQHLTDCVWYSTLRQVNKEVVHYFQITPSDVVDAKTAYAGLEKYNGYVKNPNLTTLLTEMKPRSSK